MLARTHLRRAAAAAVTVSAAIVLASCGNSTGPDNKQNALRPAGHDAKKILDLTKPFFWIAVAIGIGVVGGTIYVALRFREKPGEPRNPVQTHGHTQLEIAWTIIPALILAVMGVFTVANIFDLAKRPTGPNVVHVTVTARQWWWQFKYEDTGLVTANELHIPVGAQVALTLQTAVCDSTPTAPCYQNGVIHSFWVPELNGKKDVVPGRTQYLTLEADKAGTYRGQCAEYCGLSHADMRLRVIAQSTADYQKWMTDQLTVKPAATYAAGVQDKTYACSSCHSFDPKTPGVVAPVLAHVGDRTGFAGDKYEMTFDNLWRWVYDAPGRKPMGNLAQHMPSFSKLQGMTVEQAQAIAKFLLCDTRTASASTPLPPECS